MIITIIMNGDNFVSINTQHPEADTPSWSGNKCCRRSRRRRRRQPRRTTLPLACIEEEEMSLASDSSHSQKDFSEQATSSHLPRGLKRTDRRTVFRRLLEETARSPASPSSTLQDPFSAIFKADGTSASSIESTELLGYLPQELSDAIHPLPFANENGQQPKEEEEEEIKDCRIGPYRIDSSIRHLESQGFSWNSTQHQIKRVTFLDTPTVYPLAQSSELAEKCRRHSLVF